MIVIKDSSMQVVFLWKLLCLRCTDVTSFCMHFEKSRRGLLPEAFRSEGEGLAVVSAGEKGVLSIVLSMENI